MIITLERDELWNKYFYYLLILYQKYLHNQIISIRQIFYIVYVFILIMQINNLISMPNLDSRCYV